LLLAGAPPADEVAPPSRESNVVALAWVAAGFELLAGLEPAVALVLAATLELGGELPVDAVPEPAPLPAVASKAGPDRRS
jgi:hypothetical protein